MIKKHHAVILFISLVFFTACSKKENDIYLLSAPAGSLYTQIDKDGQTVIPNGRFITPIGKTITVAPHPYGLTFSRDGSIAVTANSGTSPLSITIVKDIQSENPIVNQIPPGADTDKGVLASVFMGLAISPDNKIVYASGGQENKIYLFDMQSGAKTDSIDCEISKNGESFSNGYIGDMILNNDGSQLFAVDQMNFRLMVIDTKSLQIIKNIGVGRYPFGVVLSPDQSKVYVANVGMFEYSRIVRKDSSKEPGLDFPPFAYNTNDAEKGIDNDSIKVFPLGSPNAPESFSVWAVDISNEKDSKVIAKIKTGNLIGEEIEGIPAIGGSSPNSLAATDEFIFVSNGNNDNISVVDINSNKVIKEIFLKLNDAVKNFRGVIPFGLAVSPDQKRLYVAESGINAVAVIEIPSFKVIGHIPVGWFPAKLKVTGDNKKLIVTNAKGFGSGPNGGSKFVPGPEGSYIGSLMKGTISVIDIPDVDQLEKMTTKVITNNFMIDKISSKKYEARKNNPVPIYGGEKESPIKHIVFISKENRTFDEVFGQIKKADGDYSLARYGNHVTFSNRDRTKTVKDGNVMANHIKLAGEYSIADNFYVDSDVSADGHRWLVNTYPNEWVESTTPASYGDNREYKSYSKAPGALAMNSSAGAIYPEDYNEAGSLWDHLERNKIEFFNFGFGVMFEPAVYKQQYKNTGIRHIANFPVPTPIFSRTSRMYPTYNTSIPDQFRIDQFIKEFSEKWINSNEEMPKLLTVIIPNDHGAGERPDEGYPFKESYMVDNDVALGRIVDFLSHTKYWKDMAIVVTEDDAQNGVDHIDAHRSVLMVISPYAKKDFVSKVHYSFGSIFKTFWNVLGLPYLNQYDAGATDLSDMFTGKPDLAPYSAIGPDIRVFDPQKALDPLDEKFNWESLKDSPNIDDPELMKKESKEKTEWRLENSSK